MMAENNGSYSKSTQDSKEIILGRLTYGKLAFLCIISLALSVVGPLAIFAPLPMAIAFLMYGKLKTFSIVAFLSITTFVLSMTPNFPKDFAYYGVILIFSSILAVSIASIVTNGEHPVKGLLKRGFLIFGCLFALVVLAELVSSTPLVDQIEAYVNKGIAEFKTHPTYKEITQAGGEKAALIEQALNNPKEALTEFYRWVFSAVFVGVFFVLWLTLFMLLRNGVVWKQVHNYQYGLKDLVKFKVPEFFVYIIVFGLALFLGGEYFGGKTLEVIGGNILYCLGVFYFFQGMGLYLDFLSFVKITGILRNVLTIMTIFFAFRIVAIAGLFDLWVNFRKYFKKNEGDIS